MIAGEPKREAQAGRPGHKLLAGYRPIGGVADEMVDASGNVRPGWDMLVSALSDVSSKERAERFGRADQYLRDAGVYYRVYEGQGAREREWPLAHLPLIISETEWQDISAGLEERAELLERIVADIYGANMLVARGLIPPALIAGNPEFLRPLVGIQPVGGHFLHFCAFELGRGPDGRWWVLGDRTQAPSGAGFALENRVATTRALPDMFGDMNVHRLAGFFRQFRDTLLSLAGDPASRAAILSPGPLNETYFEHAWIARYLGISLLEGEDLRVTDGKVMVRTVPGCARSACCGGAWTPISWIRWNFGAIRASARRASSRRSDPAHSPWSTRWGRASSRRAPCSPSCPASRASSTERSRSCPPSRPGGAGRSASSGM